MDLQEVEVLMLKAAKQIAKYTAERVVVKKTVAVSVTRLIAGTVGSTVVNNKIKQIMCVY